MFSWKTEGDRHLLQHNEAVWNNRMTSQFGIHANLEKTLVLPLTSCGDLDHLESQLEFSHL